MIMIIIAIMIVIINLGVRHELGQLNVRNELGWISHIESGAGYIFDSNKEFIICLYI